MSERSREEIERDYQRFLANAKQRGFDQVSLREGTDKTYTTSDIARIFDKTKEWVYWGLTPNHRGVTPFSDKHGNSIEPVRVGMREHRRFTLAQAREIALSCHRRGTMNYDELEKVMSRILIAEFGRDAFSG